MATLEAQHSVDVIMTLKGTIFPNVRDRFLLLENLLQVNRLGVGVFIALWGSDVIIVKAAISPLLYSEPVITQMVATRATDPRHFPAVLFNTTIKWEDQSIQLLGMEYVFGVDLSTKRLDDDATFRWFARQLLDILQDLHVTCHIVHGDLSLTNIRVRPDDSVCLIDFGLAAIRGKYLNGRAGTKLFASLRIHQIDPNYDPFDDLPEDQLEDESEEDSVSTINPNWIGYFSDLESLIYILEYCYNGLPWSDLESWDEITPKKLEFVGSHPLTIEWLQYVRTQEPELVYDVPDYDLLRSMI